MTRETFTSRYLKAGCFICHGTDAQWTGPNAQALAAQHHDRSKHRTWCDVRLSILYGADVVDDRQIDLEDAISSANLVAKTRPETNTSLSETSR